MASAGREALRASFGPGSPPASLAERAGRPGYGVLGFSSDGITSMDVATFLPSRLS